MSPTEELGHLRLALSAAGMPLDHVQLPTSRHVLLDPLRLHYLDWGSGGRRPLLFLHGGGLNAHTWDVVCAALSTEYRCLALDQRGHGDSEWSADLDYSSEAQAVDLAGFIDLLGLRDLVLVGMSMGGINALLYAADHCERLAALVLIDTGPDVRIAGGRRIVDFVLESSEADSFDELIERAMAFNPRRDPRLLRRSLLHNFRRRSDGTWVRKNDMRHWTSRSLEERVESLKKYWNLVPRIACPTLVVRGAQSDVFLDEDAQKLAQALPHGHWVRIESSGHTVQGDNPRALVDAIRAFLAPVEKSRKAKL